MTYWVVHENVTDSNDHVLGTKTVFSTTQ